MFSGTTAKGNPLGRKGTETRRRLLDTGRDLIEEMSPFSLTPVMICRAAGLTSAGFYAYFPNIAEFLFQLCETVTEEIERADLSYLDAPQDIESAILRLIDEVHALHQAHRGIVLYRNVLSDQGDARILNLRTRAALPRIEKLAALIGERLSRSERIAEAVFVNAAMESLSATAQQRFEKGHVVSWPKLRDGQARAILRILGRT